MGYPNAIKCPRCGGELWMIKDGAMVCPQCSTAQPLPSKSVKLVVEPEKIVGASPKLGEDCICESALLCQVAPENGGDCKHKKVHPCRNGGGQLCYAKCGRVGGIAGSICVAVHKE